MVGINLIPFLVCTYVLLSSLKVSGQQTRTNERLRMKHNNDAWKMIDSLHENTPSLSIGSYYDSKMVFWGRDFEEEQFGIAPYIMFNTAKGFYAYVVSNYWSANAEIPARTDLGVGFETTLADKIYVALGYEKWIARYGDEYYNSLLKNNIEVDVGFELFGIDVEPTFYYMFGEEYIFQSDILLEKKISLHTSNVSRISLKPSALATLATRTFIPMYSEFYSDQINYNKFKPVDYEASAALEIEFKNLQLEATAHYNIPVAVQYEELSPFYYFSFHLIYSHCFVRSK